MVVEAPVDDIYRSSVFLERADAAVDARPSDSIALALLTAAPLYVTEESLALAAHRSHTPAVSSEVAHAADIVKSSGPRFWGAKAGARGARAEIGSPLSDQRGALSAREEQVLRLVAAGNTNAEVGQALGLSPHTVTRHLANVYAKLGVSRRAQAVTYLKWGSRPGRLAAT